MEEIFDSATRLTGDMAGVFEYDGETGYFYLYKMDSVFGNKIIDSIRICLGTIDFTDSDISIKWDSQNQLVALLIKGEIWAVFDSYKGTKHGGDYKSIGKSNIPLNILTRFSSRSSE
jgi:hypothetical protein